MFSFNAADFASRAALTAEASRAAEEVVDAVVFLEMFDMLSSGSTFNLLKRSSASAAVFSSVMSIFYCSLIY